MTRVHTKAYYSDRSCVQVQHLPERIQARRSTRPDGALLQGGAAWEKAETERLDAGIILGWLKMCEPSRFSHLRGNHSETAWPLLEHRAAWIPGPDSNAAVMNMDRTIVEEEI